MAEASIKLPNGTEVTIQGTPDEVKELLQFYSSNKIGSENSRQERKSHGYSTKSSGETKVNEVAELDYAELIGLIKECDKADLIERNVLDQNNQLNKVLLPLYIVYKYMGNEYALTSGEISKINTDLATPISQPNASRTLSGTASRLVIGDKVKKKGQVVRYRLSRKGIQYMEELLS